jgi:hypothetical protein
MNAAVVGNGTNTGGQHKTFHCPACDKATPHNYLIASHYPYLDARTLMHSFPDSQ